MRAGDTLPMTMERLVLERLKVAAQTAVTRQVLQDADLTMIADVLTDQLVVKLQSYVLAEHLADYTQARTVLVPDRWTDHAKQAHPRACRWWSRWVWQLAPARTRPVVLTVTWTDRGVYPHAQLQLPPNPKLGPVVLWRTAALDLQDLR